MTRARPPKLNKVALATPRKGLRSFISRFEQYEKLRESGDLTVQYIAFEAMCSIAGAYKEGFKENEIREACPEAWGDKFVSLPAALVLALTDAWIIYQNSPTGSTLGEAFGVEGGGQGKRPAKELQRNRDRRRKIANDVELAYLAAGEENCAITQELAREIVAGRMKTSIDTVESAHKEYGPSIRDAMRKHQIIAPKG